MGADLALTDLRRGVSRFAPLRKPVGVLTATADLSEREKRSNRGPSNARVVVVINENGMNAKSRRH